MELTVDLVFLSLALLCSQAESIINVTHGKEHLYYRELAQLLNQCTAELKC